MQRSSSTTWQKCNICKKIVHASNFYLLENGAITDECCDCYDKKILNKEDYYENQW